MGRTGRVTRAPGARGRSIVPIAIRGGIRTRIIIAIGEN